MSLLPLSGKKKSWRIIRCMRQQKILSRIFWRKKASPQRMSMYSILLMSLMDFQNFFPLTHRIRCVFTFHLSLILKSLGSSRFGLSEPAHTYVAIFRCVEEISELSIFSLFEKTILLFNL